MMSMDGWWLLPKARKSICYYLIVRLAVRQGYILKLTLMINRNWPDNSLFLNLRILFKQDISPFFETRSARILSCKEDRCSCPHTAHILH